MAALIYNPNSNTSVPVSPHPHQDLLFSVFLILTILQGRKWYFTVVLVCSSIVTTDVEHLLRGFIGHLCISFEDMSIQILCHLKNYVNFFYFWLVSMLFIFWIQVPYEINDLQIFFFHFVCVEHKFLNLIKCSLYIFFSFCCF